MRLEGLGKLKKIHIIWTRTRGLPVCSIVAAIMTAENMSSRFSQNFNVFLPVYTTSQQK
jgi:hypothetical protein